MRDLLNKPGSVKPEADFELVWSTERCSPSCLRMGQRKCWLRCMPGGIALRLAAHRSWLVPASSDLITFFTYGMRRLEMRPAHASPCSFAARGLAEIRAALRERRPARLVLATDPDREGEAISWHVLQELQVLSSVKNFAALLCCPHLTVRLERPLGTGPYGSEAKAPAAS